MLNLCVADVCQNKKCYYHAQCVVFSDGSSECLCPTCDQSTDYSLVCASDGITYGNECWMKRMACQKQQSLVLVKREACGKLLLYN